MLAQAYILCDYIRMSVSRNSTKDVLLLIWTDLEDDIVERIKTKANKMMYYCCGVMFSSGRPLINVLLWRYIVIWKTFN